MCVCVCVRFHVNRAGRGNESIQIKISKCH